MASTSLFDLSGRRIWIFGGAGFLGQPVVRALDQQNATVICLDLPGKAEAFIAKEKLSARVQAVSLDLTLTDRVISWIRSECDQGRAPQGAAFLTTPLSGTSWEELTREEITTYNEVGLSALFCAVREVGSAMIKQKNGSLVLFSSMYGQVAPDPGIYEAPLKPNPIHYGMQKAAITQMVRYLAVTWGPHHVRCNAVAPGPFPNPTVQQGQPAFIERLAAKVPMGRIGKAEEIAGATVFLLSEASSFVNGHNLVVDGGWTSW